MSWRPLWTPRHSRYQSTLTPLSRPQNCTFMCAPDSGRPLGGHIPEHNPAICISSHETAVGSDKGRTVNLRSMATEYVSGLSRRSGHCGWLLVRAGRFMLLEHSIRNEEDGLCRVTAAASSGSLAAEMSQVQTSPSGCAASRSTVYGMVLYRAGLEESCNPGSFNGEWALLHRGSLGRATRRDYEYTGNASCSPPCRSESTKLSSVLC